MLPANCCCCLLPLLVSAARGCCELLMAGAARFADCGSVGRTGALLGRLGCTVLEFLETVLRSLGAVLDRSRAVSERPGRELNLSSSLCSSLLSLLSSPPFPLSLPSSPLPSLRSLIPVPPLPPSLPELASREASGTSQVRDRLRRNGPQRHASGVSGIRVARASQAKRAGRPREVFFPGRKEAYGREKHPPGLKDS